MYVCVIVAWSTQAPGSNSTGKSGPSLNGSGNLGQAKERIKREKVGKSGVSRFFDNSPGTGDRVGERFKLPFLSMYAGPSAPPNKAFGTGPERKLHLCVTT